LRNYLRGIYLLKNQMKKHFLAILSASFLFIEGSFAQALPKPAHIVVVIYENQAYSGIIGSSAAPYINSLLKDSNTASFTQMYANSTAASQPNYFYLYSGSDQGVTSNSISPNTPFTTCNLGASLIAKGHSYSGYCEGMPSVGYLGTTSGNYDRKHNPSSDWQGTLSNNIPPSSNQPFSNFPTNYDSLPTVAYVTPNEVDNMHSSSISNGDTWLKNNFDNYIKWAKTHNSMLIFTFDEDDGNSGEHIALLMIGQMVKGGAYSENITFLNVLRTMEDIYGLPACAGTTTATAITDVWKSASGITNSGTIINHLNIWPEPVNDELNLSLGINKSCKTSLSISDITGRKILFKDIDLQSGDNNFFINLPNTKPGIYFLNISGNEINYCKKIIIQR